MLAHGSQELDERDRRPDDSSGLHPQGLVQVGLEFVSERVKVGLGGDVFPDGLAHGVNNGE